ncbi:GntR family transcriptional regulator [Poseidonocella sp. HB161398]|uniref:GntR family transcriptional regulator n=1 Tax=Poseidonocella sp. HB161398 TaxID=2320855 RepID=UPI0011095A25|nr:GntR family transcriptional regulator [Poseidonocella sp. HB161398]
MARSDIRFRETFNQLLEICELVGTGGDLPSEVSLAETTGASRTVVRSALQRMSEAGIIAWDGRRKSVLRPPAEADWFEIERPRLDTAELEQRFFDWVLRFDVTAGTTLNVAMLARLFDVPNHVIHEFLAGLSRLALVERRRQGGWLLLGFTAEFALELTEYRTALETYALRRFTELEPGHPAWARLKEIRAQHLDLAARIETDFQDFSKLDERFHALINSAVKNRFAAESQKVISLIFHYHYMWDKTDARSRNADAIREHLEVIDALEARDMRRAEAALLDHLATSRKTLLSSLRSHQLA